MHAALGRAFDLLRSDLAATGEPGMMPGLHQCIHTSQNPCIGGRYQASARILMPCSCRVCIRLCPKLAAASMTGRGRRASRL